ncbi:hypothetical protein DPQ26_17250 [Bacillus sp. E25]|nr:hypothetical protein DOS87_17245 [Bacillus sp. CR71]AXR23455.1 hypothetical protein DPQ26_17250 [Bacillus sp. E25]KAB2364509.1 hypothetical protein F8517_24585 [Bacillus thuringiensis]PEE97536.1 hypothetical protein CON21_27575 [Bacillus thuringiensis]PGW73130.1 hypothetical protein COE21_23570 [Bacillus thuringiensis]
MLLQPPMYSVFREQDCFRDFYLPIMKMIPIQILDVENVPSVFYLYIAFDFTLIPFLKWVLSHRSGLSRAENL